MRENTGKPTDVTQTKKVGAKKQLDSGGMVCVYLDEESRKFALEIGDGNVSRGIREALRSYTEY